MTFRSVKLFIPFLAAFLTLAALLLGLDNRPVRARIEPLDGRPPQQPFNPFGTVKVNGQNVADGTPISGSCPGVTMMSNAIIFGDPPEAWYSLDIPGDNLDTPADEGCLAGETVTFEINGQPAFQTAFWAAGVPADIELTLAEPSPALGLDKGLEGYGGGGIIYLQSGITVTWKYTLTNLGDVTLYPVSLVDDNGTPGETGDDVDVCTIDRLVPGYPAVCTAAMTVTAGLVTAQATASGLFDEVAYEATDSVTYFGAGPAIALQKSTNGFDADTAPGPSLQVGETVIWSFVISNTGNISLTNVTVSDDQLGAICQPGTIEPGDPPVTCMVQGTASGGQYANLGTVTGTPLGSLEPVMATDPSHYFGLGPQVHLEKSTNGQDADAGPGPIIEVGQPVSWTFTVSNPGNLDLTGVTISDDQLGEICDVGPLAVGAEPATCTAEGTAVAGQHVNTGLVEAAYIGGSVSDTDDSHYFGATPGLDFRVLTNGYSTEGPPGPFILVGETVTWSFTLTNTGNISLTDVTVTGGIQGLLCELGTVTPGASTACQATGPANTGDYNEMFTAGAAVYIANIPVSANSESYYFGAAPDIGLEKSTNGQDADEPPGQKIAIGDSVTWLYQVTNLGNVTLANVIVTDDNGTPGNMGDDYTCTIAQLAPGQEHVCQQAGTAVEGLYANLAAVTAEFETAALETVVVSDSDLSHYEGVETVGYFIFLPMTVRK